MEAPFRFPISGLADVERLMDVLAASPLLVPSSLLLAEDQDLLMEQLASEGRVEELQPAILTSDFKNLLRTLWQQPLEAQHPRFLRFNARLAEDPSVEFSMRMDVPTTGDLPRWVDLEGSRNPDVLARLRTLYQSLGRDAQLTLLEV